MICQFHTNKCRSSINVHAFLVPIFSYMYWTFAAFASTSISSCTASWLCYSNHVFQLSAPTFQVKLNALEGCKRRANSGLGSVKWHISPPWPVWLVRRWPCASNETSQGQVDTILVSWGGRPALLLMRLWLANVSWCQYLRAKTFHKGYTHIHGILAFGKHYTFLT